MWSALAAACCKFPKRDLLDYSMHVRTVIHDPAPCTHTLQTMCKRAHLHRLTALKCQIRRCLSTFVQWLCVLMRWWTQKLWAGDVNVARVESLFHGLNSSAFVTLLPVISPGTAFAIQLADMCICGYDHEQPCNQRHHITLSCCEHTACRLAIV